MFTFEDGYHNSIFTQMVKSRKLDRPGMTLENSESTNMAGVAAAHRAQVQADWQAFLTMCLGRRGDAERYGKMKATLAKRPGNARAYANTFRGYLHRTQAVLPGPEAVHEMGPVFRALKFPWCSNLTLLYAASHLEIFVDMIVGANLSKISKDRLALLVVGIAVAVLPCPADHDPHLKGLYDSPKDEMERRLRYGWPPTSKKALERLRVERQEYLTRGNARIEHAVLTHGEISAFDSPWRNFVAGKRRSMDTLNGGAILSRLAAESKELPLEVKRRLVIQMLCRSLINKMPDVTLPRSVTIAPVSG